MMPLLTSYLLAVAQTRGKHLEDVSIFARATKVPGVKLKYLMDYDWLDNNRVMVGEKAKFGKSYRFAIYDIEGKAVAQPDILNKTMTDPELGNLRWQISPNRKLLLIIYGVAYPHIAKLDGSESHEVDIDGRHKSNYWLGDNRHLISTWIGPSGRHFYYYDAYISDTYKLESPRKIENNEKNPIYVDGTKAFASTKDEMVAIDHGSRRNTYENTTQLYAYRRPLKGKRNQSRTSTMGIKLKGRADTVELSPDCTKIAVIQNSVGLPLSNGGGRDKRSVVCVWVSKITGSEAKQVGCIVPSAYERNGGPIYGLRWLPDGKRLSFGYNGSLYVVPANGPDFSWFVSPQQWITPPSAK